MIVAAALRALLDCLENVLLLKDCAAYPEKRLEGEAKAAGTATRIKSVLMALWVAGLFVCLLLRAVGIGA